MARLSSALVRALLLLCLLAVTTAAATAGLDAGAGVGGMLTVQVHYPTARVGSRPLRLVGSACGLDWDAGVALALTKTDLYTTVLKLDACAGMSELQVKVRLDGTWSLGSNSRIDVGSATVARYYDVHLYPWFFTTSGKWSVVENRLYSPQLNNYRGIVVYLPPSYVENGLQAYNVLLMHDGQNLFDPATSAFGTAWLVQDAMNRVVIEGSGAEAVIIGINNTPDRTNELTYSYDKDTQAGGKGDRYLDFLLDTVLPWASSLFRIKTGRDNVALMGSSLGGLISCYGGWTRASRIGRMGCMSSSFWWNDEDFNTNVTKVIPAASPRTLAYIDSGDSGPSMDGRDATVRVVNHLVSLGYSLGADLTYYLDRGGQHSEIYWQRRVHLPLRALFPIPLLPLL